MATLKDVQFSMNGEPGEKVKPIDADYVPDAKGQDSINGPGENLNKLVIFKLVKKNTGGVYIQPIDYAINPKEPEKGPQMIRLLKGVPSIWAKDQKDIPENKVGKLMEFLEWPKGSRYMFVQAYDKAKLEFMELCCHNRLNPNRTKVSKTEFFLYDPEAADKERLAAEMKEIEMLMKAQTQPVDKMKKHLFYLGGKLTHDITGAPKSDDSLRMEYLLAAKRNPVEFEKSFDSKEVDIHYKIRQLVIDSKLDISRNDGRIYWGNNGAVACNIPKGENPITYLTQLALTNSKEGKEFKTEIDRIAT
jgi:hypothetical protein